MLLIRSDHIVYSSFGAFYSCKDELAISVVFMFVFNIFENKLLLELFGFFTNYQGLGLESYE